MNKYKAIDLLNKAKFDLNERYALSSPTSDGLRRQCDSYNISKNSKIERILLRKYYHLMAVLMFLPAVILQPKFLDLAFGAALAVFLTLEIIRVWRIWPLGQLVHEFMNAFTDHRDSDLLIVSHFSLLLGCALPIWMSSGYNDRPLAPFAGILSLGIGDTMASMVGHKYGVLRWSKTGSKFSLE
ncbi:dolichol kinase [Populus alba x Populus x berolinensis]|nr:dolichol kinase [Populus alba x Populus x berolinensis]